MRVGLVADASPLGLGVGRGVRSPLSGLPALKQYGNQAPVNLGSRVHLACLLCCPSPAPGPLTVLSLGCCCWSCFIMMLRFLSLHRLF